MSDKPSPEGFVDVFAMETPESIQPGEIRGAVMVVLGLQGGPTWVIRETIIRNPPVLNPHTWFQKCYDHTVQIYGVMPEEELAELARQCLAGVYPLLQTKGAKE